jgi:ABC-type multidrug transport system fused ATPase/permease subunit
VTSRTPAAAASVAWLLPRTATRARTRVFAVLVAVAAAAAELVVPLAVALGVSRVALGTPVGAEVWLPVLAAVLLSGLLSAVRVIILSRVAAEEMRQLRLRVAERLVGLSPREVEQLGVDEGLAVYSRYVDELEPLLTAERIRRAVALATIGGCLVLMVVFEWRLALALLGTLLVSATLVGLAVRPVRGRAARGLGALARTAADLGEYLRSIRSATVFGLGRTYLDRLGGELDDVRTVERQVGQAQAAVDLVVKVTSMLALFGLGALGAALVSSGLMTLANLAGFLGALGVLLAPAALYAELTQGVQRAKAALPRLDGIPPGHAPVGAAAPVAPADIASVQIDGVTLSPGDAVVIGPVGLLAGRGDFVCVTGPSGSGKTTLLSAVAGFEPIAGGSIRVGQHDLDAWAPAELWRNLAFVEQGTPIIGATVREFISPGVRRFDDAELTELVSAIGLGTRLGTLGLDTPLQRAGTSLSGGEQQRFSLVRALVSDRPVLLLDEPTAHLDDANESAVLDLLDRYRRDRILIVASHSPAVMERADIVVDLAADAAAGAAGAGAPGAGAAAPMAAAG